MLHIRLDRGSDYDRGETLVELVITIAIIGLAVTALLGGLVTALASSGEHRSFANLDTILRSNAEETKYLVELQPGAWYQDGATITPTSYNGNTIPLSAPTDYSVIISGIQYWNGSTNQFDSSYSAPADATGYQLITLKATAPNGVSATLAIGVRTSA